MMIEEKLSQLLNAPVVYSGSLAGVEWAVVSVARPECIYHRPFTQFDGYVLIPANHPWHESLNPNVDVHGGVTFNQHDVWGFHTGYDADGWGRYYKWTAETVRGETLYLASQVLGHDHTHEVLGVEHV